MKALLLLIFVFFSGSEIEWETDFMEAKKEAQYHNKKILVYFSGSDWCKPCIQMKKFILDTEEFTAYSKDNFVLFQVDFPKLKKNRLDKALEKQNEELASKYNKNGVFPLVVIMDKNEKVLSTVEYRNQSTAEFIHQLERL